MKNFAFKNREGQSLVEVIIAMAIFALMTTTMVVLTLGSYAGLLRGGNQLRAAALANEAVEALKSVQESGWNKFIDSPVIVGVSGSHWDVFSGASELIDSKFMRTIIFEDVCRDISDAITDCPGSYTDVFSKKIIITVTWNENDAVTGLARRVAYLTNWDSIDWTQTDWAGGDGQVIWSDPLQFESGTLDYTTGGELSLAEFGGNNDWTFVTDTDYFYDTAKIEVVSGLAQLKSTGAGGINDIFDTAVDTLEYDASNGGDPEILNIGGEIYLIAFRGANNDGYVKTVNISALGEIGTNYIDELEFDATEGFEPSLIQISNTIYAVAYRGPNNDGYAKTFSVDTNGNIGNTTIDSLKFSTGNGNTPVIVEVGDGFYAVAYEGANGDGFVRTFTIDSAGNIGSTAIDSLEFDAVDGKYPDIINVGEGYYAIAYQGASDDGFIKTITIDTVGNIGDSIVDVFEFDTSDGADPDIINISEDIYAVAYSGVGSDGFVVTIAIDSVGNIANAITDIFEHDADYSRTPDFKHVVNNLYLIIHTASFNPGSTEVDMFGITPAGDITNTLLDTWTSDAWTYDANVGLYPKLINVSQMYWAVVYGGPQNDGYVDTLLVEEGATMFSTDKPTISPSASLTLPSEVDALNLFSEASAKNGGEIYYQLSNDGGESWKFWDGGAWANAVGTIDYNTADIINANISSFDIASGSFSFRAFLESDGSQLVQLDTVSVAWDGGSFVASGYAISSSFNMGNMSPIQVIEWDENMNGCVACDVQMQLRAAPDAGGAPGAWSDWYGASGAGTYFIDNLGTLVDTALNGNQWVQYRAQLSGDGVKTPILQEVRVNYK